MPEWLKVILRPLYFRIYHWRGNPGLQIQVSRIEEIIHEYDQVFTYRLETEPFPEFIAGQYCHLIAPGAILDNHHIQHMSFANAPHETDLLISMDLASGSRFKRRFQNANVGDPVRFFKVKGDFTLSEKDRDRQVVMVAGGIGITPFRSMAADFLKAGKTDWSLLYTGKGYLYQDFWEKCADQVTFLDRGTVQSALEETVASQSDALFLICGHEDFVTDIRTFLTQKKIKPASIRIEDFSH